MRRALIVAGAMALLLLAVFVWPTFWSYQPETAIHDFAGQRKVLVRVHRLTGKSEFLASHGWVPLR